MWKTFSRIQANAIKGKVINHEIIVGRSTEYVFPDGEIVEFELVKWKKRDLWLVIAKEYIDDGEGYIVNDPDFQLFRLLQFLIQEFHVKYTTGTTSDKFVGVSEIEIKGIPDESDMKELIEKKIGLSGYLPEIDRPDRSIWNL